jgi:glycerophosphoryl diester phosphodiesterase
MGPIPGQQPLSIAHRGAHQDYPENSLQAILLAVEMGARGVEIDIRVTSDGVLVLHHDPDLADGRAVAGLSAREIAATTLAPGIPIPTLDEALDAVSGRAILFIETKVGGIEFPLIRAIRRTDADCAVHSFHHETIRNLKLTMPALRTGILTEGKPQHALDAVRTTNADDVWHSTHDLDGDLVRHCHRLGKQVIAWTVNSSAECRRLEGLGVDGICTDDLSLLSALSR